MKSTVRIPGLSNSDVWLFKIGDCVILKAKTKLGPSGIRFTSSSEKSTADCSTGGFFSQYIGVAENVLRPF